MSTRDCYHIWCRWQWWSSRQYSWRGWLFGSQAREFRTLVAVLPEWRSSGEVWWRVGRNSSEFLDAASRPSQKCSSNLDVKPITALLNSVISFTDEIKIKSDKIEKCANPAKRSRQNPCYCQISHWNHNNKHKIYNNISANRKLCKQEYKFLLSNPRLESL